MAQERQEEVMVQGRREEVIPQERQGIARRRLEMARGAWQDVAGNFRNGC